MGYVYRSNLVAELPVSYAKPLSCMSRFDTISSIPCSFCGRPPDCSCDGKIVIDMSTILNNNGSPIREFFGSDEAECIYGTNTRNVIYGYGGSVRLQLTSMLFLIVEATLLDLLCVTLQNCDTTQI